MRLQKGFTLIELLTVIAVIGMLATILLVSVTGARDDAKESAVLSQMKSVQAVMLRCVNKNKAMYCGSPTVDYGIGYGPVNCNDTNTVNTWHLPAYKSGGPYYFASDGALCGSAASSTDEDVSFGYWPDITKYGFRYGARADSNYLQNRFAFYAFKLIQNTTDPRTFICCTQNGCTSSEQPASFFVFSGGYTWALTDACLQEAGFTFNASGIANGD